MESWRRVSISVWPEVGVVEDESGRTGNSEELREPGHACSLPP